MARGSIKGRLPTNSSPAGLFTAMVRIDAKQPRAREPEELLGFDPADFAETKIITNHATAIYRQFFSNCASATRSKRRQKLRWFSKLVASYKSATGRPTDRPEQIDSQFLSFAFEQILVGKSKSANVAFCNGMMDCLRIPKELRLPNLWQTTDPEVKDGLDDRAIAQLLKKAKEEAREIISRTDELDRLGSGCDPRRTGSGRWSVLADRLWAVKNILQLRVMTWMDTNREFAFLCKALEDKEGAALIAPDGTIKRGTGLIGHLRYFYPGGRDLAPFLILLMIRTSFNLSTVARLEENKWLREYAFAPPPGSKDGVCYIEGPKSRGKQKRGEPDKMVRAISLLRPWSHPFKILKFVEKLTAQSRTEIRRHIKLLSEKEQLSDEEKSILVYYNKIKDHIFVYHAKGRFYSAWNEVSGTPEFLQDAMASYGVPCPVKTLRDAGLTFALAAPGGSTAILQLLASHSQRIVTYERRKQTLSDAEKAMKAIFHESLMLVEKGAFSIREIRRALKAQGFSVSQIANVTNPENTTIWGNGCADPTAPPPEFADDTITGQYCSTQRCIDGCPWARWFPSSIPHVRRMKTERENELATLGLEATLGSSHDHRLRGLTQLLSSWPPEILREYNE